MSTKKDRQSTTGISGAPKKGGAGGHGAWGKGGMDDLKDVSQDPHDPNYDSEREDQEEVVINRVEVVAPIDAVLTEFFRSGDMPEVLKSIGELNLGDNQQQFVKKALARGLEKQAYERELVSKLLSTVYNAVIEPAKTVEGFEVALNSLDDFVLDTPDAVDVLSKFLARAIVDEIVPPAFLKTARADSARAKEAIALATGLVTEKHKLDRLAHVWGPGDFHSVRHMKEEINTLLEEYLVTGDTNEADRCVRKLNAPSFHFQVVKQAIRLALSKPEEQRKKFSNLLSFFVKEGLISQTHVVQGFALSYASLNDIKLDIPTAPATLAELAQEAKRDGWLPQSFDAAKQQQQQ